MEQLQQSEIPLKIDGHLLKKAALIVRAVNHKLRQQILQLLHQHGKLPVKEIYIMLRLEQSVASQQLAILRTAGFVSTTRAGKQVFYSVILPAPAGGAPVCNSDATSKGDKVCRQACWII